MKIIPMQSVALANIRGGEDFPCIIGTVRFYQLPCGVLIEADVSGLPRNSPGFLGFHIHEGTGCSGAEFADTKGHFNPAMAQHPGHAGDLPPLLCAGGKAWLSVLTDRFCVRDILGRTVVIHSRPDDFHTQPAGDAGDKIACGVIHATCGCSSRNDICNCKKEKC